MVLDLFYRRRAYNSEYQKKKNQPKTLTQIYAAINERQNLNLRCLESREGRVLTNMRHLQSDFLHTTGFTMKKVRIANTYFSIATLMHD